MANTFLKSTDLTEDIIRKFGSRIRKKARKDENFLDRVIRNRDHVLNNPYNLDYPCVGPCFDENGKPIWVQSTNDPWTEEEYDDYLFNRYKLENGSILMDPLLYSDDIRGDVRDFARNLMSGGNDFFDKIRKVQRVYDDGSVMKMAYKPYPFFDKLFQREYVNADAYNRFSDRHPTTLVRYRGGYNRDLYPALNRRSKPIRYINVPTVKSNGGYEIGFNQSKFVPINSVSRHDVSNMKSNRWGFEDWNLSKFKKNEPIDISDYVEDNTPLIQESRNALKRKDLFDRYELFPSDIFNGWKDNRGNTRFMWNAKKGADEEREFKAYKLERQRSIAKEDVSYITDDIRDMEDEYSRNPSDELKNKILSRYKELEDAKKRLDEARIIYDEYKNKGLDKERYPYTRNAVPLHEFQDFKRSRK